MNVGIEIAEPVGLLPAGGMPGFYTQVIVCKQSEFQMTDISHDQYRLIAKNNSQKMLLLKYYCSNYQYKYVMVACYISSAL